MINLRGLLLILHLFVFSKSFLLRSPERKPSQRIEGHVGEPLILTPYVENGNITAGRELSRVHFTEYLNITSYSGFFTVNKAYDSNQFFWYFPAIDGNKTAPLLVWLQGGPGASSLFGLFEENGPIRMEEIGAYFDRRQCTWAANHHVLYIDNPVGTGFSFTNNGYCTNQTQVGEELYSFVTQFLKLFSELQKNEFFITGESYGGKYVPALAYKIHKMNPTAEIKVNLKGIAIGNGFSDPEHQLVYSKYLYQIGLLDWNQAETVAKYENKTIKHIQKKQWKEASEMFGDLVASYANFSGLNMVYNYLHTKPYYDSDWPYLRVAIVRKAIHVGKVPFNSLSKDVYQHLFEDMPKSVAPWISELLDHYRVLTYNGQLDTVVAYPLTVNFLRNLNFTASKEYKTAERHQWYVNGTLAGYVKQAGNLIEVMVRNAGHMVPMDQPEWSLDMITRFTHNTSFYNNS
ncbi:unnamed protein product [Diatraea saccharalis]|uniref:Carboxypeptidase n=1 Tax=Diatraea saccharalis TaxID=40085 RepID=A0A9N9R607_9NEOP|nr:unnamed protein product [Diatraea saccharalis]